jgi:hypothetical protein
LSVQEARGAVKPRPLTNERGGQAGVRRGAPARAGMPPRLAFSRARASRYRSAGGGVRLPSWGAFPHPVTKQPPPIDTPSGL